MTLYEHYADGWDKLPDIRKLKCSRCGKTEDLTKHHLKNEEGERTQITVVLCQSCHDEKHGIKRKIDETSIKKQLNRKIRRAKKRIKRDQRIIREAGQELETFV